MTRRAPQGCLKALIFDVDGTLADTEELHRRAFNSAFRAHHLPWVWSPQRYGELLRIAGGKERIAHHIRDLGLPPELQQPLMLRVGAIHTTKSELYRSSLEHGSVALRPGVARLLAEARAAGARLAIASTTSPDNVTGLLAGALGQAAPAGFAVIATGDAARRKKPAPDVYQLALAQLGLSPQQAAAFEDSAIGVAAAKAAGLFTIATPSAWTRDEDLGSADLLLSSLGEPDAPLEPAAQQLLRGPCLTFAALARLHAQFLRRQGGHDAIT